MSLYQLHRCVWDRIRSGEVGSNQKAAFDVGRYDLTDDERVAFETTDIGALYEMGLHPVLLNAFCRASGYTRDDYRKVLEKYAEPETRKGRWQR